MDDLMLFAAPPHPRHGLCAAGPKGLLQGPSAILSACTPLLLPVTSQVTPVTLCVGVTAVRFSTRSILVPFSALA